MLLLGSFYHVLVDEVLLPSFVAVYEGIDSSPIGESTHVTVVDEEVGLDLAAIATASAVFLLEVAIDGVEGDAALLAPFDGFVEEFVLTDAPENETMAFFGKAAEGRGGEGKFLANGGVTVFDDCAVEIYCDGHGVLVNLVL